MLQPNFWATNLAPMQVASGRSYEQRLCALDEEGGWPSPGVQAWPTAMQADELAGYLRRAGLCAVSIGCGEGAFEAMLERRGVCVTAVDLDVLSDPQRYAAMRRFCTCPILRVRPDALYELPRPASTALCFVWGRALPWRAYLARYPLVPVCVIVGEPSAADGDGCATEPRGGALDGDSEWRRCRHGPLRCVHGGATIDVYERRPAAGPDMAVPPQPPALISGAEAHVALAVQPKPQ